MNKKTPTQYCPNWEIDCGHRPRVLGQGYLGNSDESSSEEWKELEERNVQPLIKTERQVGLQDSNTQTTVHMTPWLGPELSELKTKFSHKPGKMKWSIYGESL